MKIIVNDANILIDLVDLKILPYFFQLEFEFHTTAIMVFGKDKNGQNQTGIVPKYCLKTLKPYKGTPYKSLLFANRQQCFSQNDQELSGRKIADNSFGKVTR